MAEAAAPQGIESFIEEIAEARRSMGNQSPSFRSSLMSNITGIFKSPSSDFEGDVNADGKDEEEEALHWAVIEKLPSYKRIRASILKEYENDEDGGQVINRRVVDVGHLKPLERHLLIEKLVTNAERDNEKLLRKLKDRIDRVGIELPTVEVRYQNLNVDAECQIGSRNLPTLWNVIRNVLEGVLETMHLSLSKKVKLPILKDVNGLIQPSRCEFFKT